MKKFKELSNQIKEKDEREYDYEGAMAKTQLKTIIRNAENIHDMLDDDENLPEWIQSKITLAKDYIVLASNYLESEMDESSSAYDRINKRFKDLSGRSLGDAAKEHGAEAKKLQKEIDAQKAENERRKAAMKTEEVELEEGISKVYHNFMAKRAGTKADHAYDMDDEKEFQKQVDKTEYHRVKAGGKPTRINTNPNAKMLTTRASRNEEVELDEAIPKSTHYATLHSSSRKIVAKGNKKDMLKKMKELNKKEEGSHHLGVTHRGKVGDIFGEEVELDEIAVVKTNKPIGTRVADIGPGGKEFNVKTNKAYDDAKKKKPQGAFFATQRRKERLASSGRMDEEIESLDEKNEPTNPALWSRAKSLAKSKFDVYPSAYANGWASKWYKSKGGGWKTVSEAKEDNLPFKPDEPKKKSVVVGKKPEGYSIARQLARQAMQKQVEKLKKPVKESEEKATEPFITSSRKAQIVKDIAKKKMKEMPDDKFQDQPVLSNTITRNN